MAYEMSTALLPLCSDTQHRKGEFRLLLHLQNFKGKNIIPETLPASEVYKCTSFLLSQKLKACTLPDAG